MKKKYNLALTPISKSKEVITLAKKFSGMADEYWLGNGSLPHITLYRFDADENEIESIWKRVCVDSNEPPLFLVFNKFSCITFDNLIFWISLLPDHFDVLNKKHIDMANILQLPVKKTFDPHMTLVNTKNKEYEKTAEFVFASYQPIADHFILSLGVSDDVGQLTNILYSTFF